MWATQTGLGAFFFPFPSVLEQAQGWVDLGRLGSDQGAVSLPYFLAKRLRAPSHQRTDAVMLQKAKWGRQQAGLHSTLLRLWASMLSATSHCQQYLFKTSTWPLRANKLGAKGWCLLYKAVISTSLEPAAPRSCLALQESFHAYASFWDA